MIVMKRVMAASIHIATGPRFLEAASHRAEVRTRILVDTDVTEIHVVMWELRCERCLKLRFPPSRVVDFAVRDRYLLRIDNA